jgi:exonuclease SbcD
MFTFLHAADIHLDSQLQGLENYEGAPVDAIRRASRDALENLVDLGLAQAVQFVVLAGDLYDGDWKDYNTGLFFVKQMARLKDGGIPVVLITGNHDAANRMTKSLRLPANVTMLSTETSETHLLTKWQVAVHGQGFATPAVTEDLSLRYPARLAGYFNIGLLHTCVTGREGHARYAPCTLEGLLTKNYDYWALGHIHQRDILHENPCIVFPGNLQGRHIRERGPKGCMLVTVDDAGRAKPEFRPLDVFRWELCEVKVDEAEDVDAVLGLIQAELARSRLLHDLPRAVRVLVRGYTKLHSELLAESSKLIQEVRGIAEGKTWIEKVQWQTQPETGDPFLRQEGPLGELLGLLHEWQTHPQQMEERIMVMKDLQDLAKKMLHHTGEGLPFQDMMELRGFLDQAGSLLTRQLCSRRIKG